MKTKVLHKQKEKVNFDKNFLNNQNYILWKTEKKKLLSKFFVEKMVNYFFNLVWSNNYIFSIIWFFLFILITFQSFWMLLWAFGIYIVMLFATLDISYKERIEKKNIKNIKDIFIEKVWKNQDLSIIIMILFFILTFYINIIIIFGWYWLFNLYGIFFYYYTLFIIFFLWFYYKENLLNINLWAIAFYPFLLFLLFFKIFYSYCYVIFIKKIKWFSFLKKKPKIKFLEKFEIINKDYAENKYYKIQQK